MSLQYDYLFDFSRETSEQSTVCLTSWNVLFWRDGGRFNLITSLDGLNTKDPIVWQRTLTHDVKMFDAYVEDMPNLSARSSRRRSSLSFVRQRINFCFASNFLRIAYTPFVAYWIQVRLGQFHCFMCWVSPCKTFKMSLTAWTVGISV